MAAETSADTRAYCLEGVDGEHLLVVRTSDIELLHTLVRRMARMRDERLKVLGRALEEELHGKH